MCRGSRSGERCVALAPGVTFVLFVVALFALRPDLAVALVRILPLHAVPMGSESAVAFLAFEGIPVALIFVTLFVFDLATSMPLLAFADPLQRLPLVGALFVKMETRGSGFYTRHAWLRRLGPLGLVAFVALPLSGTGTGMGVLLGRIAGMGPYLVASLVMVGTFVRWVFVVGVASVAAGLF